MTVVVVGNEKGGCGKTTIAVNLAAESAAAGFTTLLIDADPGQQSAAKWWARRREAHPSAPAIDCRSVPMLSTEEEMYALALGYQTVVVDTGAMDSPQLRIAVRAANVLVIPVQPNLIDLWTLPTIGRVFDVGRQKNDDLKAIIVLNNTPVQREARLLADARAWIDDNVPVLQDIPLASVIHRIAYGDTVGDGLGVAEAKRRNAKAAVEIQKLFEEVLANGSSKQARRRHTAQSPAAERRRA